MKDDIVFTGGGTAGHVFPGIAVIQALKRLSEDISIIWIGSTTGMERGLIVSYDIRFYGIPAGKLRRYFSFKNFIDPFKVAAGFFKAFWILLKIKPGLVFSKGGYVTVPVVIAAKMLRIPVFTHESDIDPGLATKMNSRFAEKILVSYLETKDAFPIDTKNRIIVTGNPVRTEILSGSSEKGKELFGINKDEQMVLILGGSQGALQINKLIEPIVNDLSECCFVIHQMGSYSFKKSDKNRYITAEFFKQELPDLLAAADIVISRAGASVLWEMAALGKPSILIPLGSGSSRGDQMQNAEFFYKKGASIILSGDVTPQILYKETTNMLKDIKLRKKMGDSALKIAGENTAEKIADIILRRAGGKN